MRWVANLPTVAAGIGLVLLVNLALLGSATWNFRGGPVATLSLTERELAMPLDQQEKSAGLVLSLRLATDTPRVLRRAAWIRHVELPRVELPWFDREKLRELGFRVDVEPDDPAGGHRHEGQRLAVRRVYLVLEYDGEAWHRWLAGREARLDRLRREVEAGLASASDLAEAEAMTAFDRVARSRLFPVDAGRDAAALLRRYRDRHVVLPGLVAMEVDFVEGGAPVWRGRVRGLLVDQIGVPRRYRAILDPLRPAESSGERSEREREEALAGWPSPTPPRYRAELAVGRGFGPWLTAVELSGRSGP